MIFGIRSVPILRIQEICHRTWKNISKNSSWKEDCQKRYRQKLNACLFRVIVLFFPSTKAQKEKKKEKKKRISISYCDVKIIFFDLGPFLPCQDLFDWWTLRCGVWVVFLLAMLGNGTVVFVLIFARSKIDVPRFLVCNLAAADFFMGLYLGI